MEWRPPDVSVTSNEIKAWWHFGPLSRGTRGGGGVGDACRHHGDWDKTNDARTGGQGRPRLVKAEANNV